MTGSVWTSIINVLSDISLWNFRITCQQMHSAEAACESNESPFDANLTFFMSCMVTESDWIWLTLETRIRDQTLKPSLQNSWTAFECTHTHTHCHFGSPTLKTIEILASSLGDSNLLNAKHHTPNLTMCLVVPTQVGIRECSQGILPPRVLRCLLSPVEGT